MLHIQFQYTLVLFTYLPAEIPYYRDIVLFPMKPFCRNISRIMNKILINNITYTTNIAITRDVRCLALDETYLPLLCLKLWSCNTVYVLRKAHNNNFITKCAYIFHHLLLIRLKICPAKSRPYYFFYHVCLIFHFIVLNFISFAT